MTRCCKCKKSAYCLDNDGKTPYCEKCWKEKAEKLEELNHE